MNFEFESIEKYIPYIGIVIFFIIGVLINLNNKKKRLLRKLSKFKFKDASKFQNNQPTKITGKVSSIHKPFIAPLSKRKCVAYEFKIEQKKAASKNNHWSTLVEEKDIQEFLIEKNNDMVFVNSIKSLKNYESYLVKDKSISTGFLDDVNPDFKALLNKYNISTDNYLAKNKTLRCSERILEVGEVVTVAGIAKWKAIDKAIPGYNYSKIAALDSDETQKLVITDLPKAAKPKQRIR